LPLPLPGKLAGHPRFHPSAIIVNKGIKVAGQAGFDTRLPVWPLPIGSQKRAAQNMLNRRRSFNPEPTATVIQIATDERLRLRLRVKRRVSNRFADSLVTCSEAEAIG